MTWVDHKNGKRHISVDQRRLRRTVDQPQATLDLHGYTLAAAQAAVAQFLDQASAQGVSPLLVIHGRGGRHPGRTSLCDVVPAWVRHHPAVIAHQPAPVQLGGNGAMVVWVRRR